MKPGKFTFPTSMHTYIVLKEPRWKNIQEKNFILINIYKKADKKNLKLGLAR